MKFNALVFVLIFIANISIFYSCKKEDPFVNTPPTIENQQFSINKNTPNGVMVDTVKATDIDKNQKLKYSIISGNFDAAFRIDSLTGVIYVNNSLALDYEKTKIFELGVRVKDDYKNPLTASAKITITIKDLFENRPPIINNQNFSVDENKPNGTYVGTVLAMDYNANQTLTFSIIYGNTNNAFGIEASTGKLYVNNISALNFEANPSFSLQVKVSDNYTISLSDTATVTIKIQDLEEVTIPQNGLVAYYPFNGNANDESGNSHNGTVYGASLTTDRHHKANSAYGFNGINSYINTFSTFDYQYRTVSFWAYFNDVTTFQLLLSQDSNLLNYGLFLASITNGLFTLQGGGGGSPTVWYQTNTITTNRWYHFVMIRNGSINQYYINGDLVGTASSNTSGSAVTPNINFIIGSDRTTTNRMFNGKIDDIAIYNRALSTTEINTIYGVK
jgi:hypothetical protein